MRMNPSSGKRILITGGAGFIGSHLADELLDAGGYRVRLLDALLPQVHGDERQPPAYLNPKAELIIGDLRDPNTVRQALDGVDMVCHLAAAVGVGQSMYEIVEYTSANAMGTAVLMQALTERPVERLVVASSMSVYGEGLYETSDGRKIAGAERLLEQLRNNHWELRDSADELLSPVPTPETKTPSLASVYALNKYEQEQLCLITGRAYGIPTIALRLFNVYGTRQSLSNPYTGVLAIFLSRLMNNKPPIIYEDGLQQRDFVSVHDVARAFRLALETPRDTEGIFNIGSGNHYTVLNIAYRIAEVVNKPDITPHVTGKCRVGDIRHCFADISKAKRALGFEPLITLDAGLQELADWMVDQVATDRVDEANRQLSMRGLTV